MRRVAGLGRQHGEDVAEEVILEPDPFAVGQAVAVDHHQTDRRQLALQLAPQTLLLAGQRRHRLLDHHQLLGRRQAVVGAGGEAGTHLFDQARDADHEELVEIVGRDRQEAQALEQRMIDVGALFEDASVEPEPGELAVDETTGGST